MIDGVNKLTETRYGQMVYNANDEYIGKSLGLYGEWAQLEKEFLTPYIPYGGVCIDVGAYIGTSTLFFADSVGPEGIVIAFEPEQMMFQLLCANIALNNFLNVRVFNCAADAAPGMLKVTDLNYREPNNFAGANVREDNGYPIEARTLDDCAVPAVDLIKIDVEGWESNVVNGAVQTIQTHQPFIYAKYHPEEDSEDLVQLIQSFEYDVYEHNVAAYNPRNFKKASSDFLKNIKEVNLFCVPKSKELMIDELPLMPE
jgi:FkbM family methyltransferase